MSQRFGWVGLSCLGWVGFVGLSWFGLSWTDWVGLGLLCWFWLVGLVKGRLCWVGSDRLSFISYVI